MATVSLVVSSPPPTTTTAPVLDKNMTDSELAGEEREDGELEDGEIDDEGIGIEDENKDSKEVNEDDEKRDREKEKGKEKEDKIHRHSRKRSKKTREKRRSKRRRRDRQRHHSPSSTSSSDSYDSDDDWDERPKPRKSQASSREPDGQTSQHGRDSKATHGNSQKSPQHKSGDFDKYSDYSDDKYDYEEEEEDCDDYTDDMSDYQHAKDSAGHANSRGRHAKRGNMRGQHNKQFGQRGRGRGSGAGRGRGMLNKNNNKKMKGKNWGGRGRGRGGDQATEGGGAGGGGGMMKPEGKNSSGFQKKRPIMSKEFINQHTVEHNGRYICKYFLEGRCIKGEQCKFEHDLVIPDKKKELCKFYLQGYCSKGDNCIYMHNEYPCKFFHTGAKCYQGENCKFSHDALNDVTKELLNKIINTEEDNAHDDEMELEDLRKQGIAPLPKPPPGVGLLPTPDPNAAATDTAGGKKIPSLFEIKVQPTVDLAQKIALSGSQYQEDDDSEQFGGSSEDAIASQQGGGEGNATPAPSGSAVPSLDSPGGGPTVPPVQQQQSPTGQQHPVPPVHHHHHGFPMPPPPLPPPPGHPPPPFLHGNQRPNMNNPPPPFPPMPPDLQMLQSLFPFPPLGPNPVEFFSSFLRSQAMSQGVDPGLAFMQSLQQQMGADQSQMLSLPPAVQKALFLHMTQQQQHQPPQPEDDSQRGDSQEDTMGANKDETPNWYSSDDEDGSCMVSILRSLQKQAHQQPPSLAPAPPGDPRLQKEPCRVLPSDPRVKTDPRQRPPDPRKESDGAATDPRLARDPRKVRPAEPNSYRQQQQKPPAAGGGGGDDDEEGETREIRDRAVLIPLDARPGAVLRDPRCQLKQFSHIRVDVVLQRPAFAQTVVWAPEDLIPMPEPKQEHSINLPLPPLIADAQMNRSALPPDCHPHHRLSPPPIDPRLAAARLKEGVLNRMPSSRVLESRSSLADRPLDPRQNKASSDPRIKRTLSLDSKLALQKDPSSGGGGGVVDPRLQRASGGTRPAMMRPTVTAEHDKLPPYAPRLSSSSPTSSGLESPSTAILGGISLYDPRNQAEAAATTPRDPQAATEPPKKMGILKHPAKKESDAVLSRRGSVEEVAATGKNVDPGGSSSGPTASEATPDAVTPIKPPALHNLPVQAALAGLVRPTQQQYAKVVVGQQGSGDVLLEEEEKQEKMEEEPKKGKVAEEEDEEADDRTLKDVFKTFDPTASPFCQ